ncbi:MAG: UvrD-helicase domain-containing protein, partial [Longimicrobiales bacterium]
MKAPPLPREMVLASAGSGKTYHLSGKLVGLLALEEAPETIWASTFTRKAAAEILDRVLLRLARGALEEEEARKLAASAWMGRDSPPPDAFLDPEQCGRLLSRLVHSLHRTNIGTLDSFFVQVAKTFTEELGLPPAWRLVQGPQEDRIRSEALEAVLAGEDPGVLAELVRILTRGEVRRGVHAHLLDKVDDLLLLLRDVDPSVPDAWKPVFSGLGPGEMLPEEGIRRSCQELADDACTASGGHERPAPGQRPLLLGCAGVRRGSPERRGRAGPGPGRDARRRLRRHRA